MSTSIVQIYTPEGFVVAADGREYDPRTGRIMADNIRKIFTVSERRRLLLYAMSGTNKIRLRGEHVEVDLLELLHAYVRDLSESPRKSLWHYAQALSHRFEDLPEHENEDEPTVIYLDGYYRGRPKRAVTKINHNGNENQPPSVDDPIPGKIEGCGSNIVLDALKQNSQSTAKYATPLWKLDNYERASLAQALAIAKSYIGAQCDDDVRKMDSRWCNTIGGVGHLCVLRPSGEFEWVFRNKKTGEWLEGPAPQGSTVP